MRINLRNKFALRTNNKFYYGWAVLLLSALATFFSSPGQTYSISAFIDSYIGEFDYTRTMISSIYSVATILSGSLIVFMGKAVDKFGQRRMMMIAGFMLGISCLFNSFIISIPMIFIGFFLLRYFGQGSLTLIPGSLVPQWFEKNRALAMSLLAFGNMIGNMLVPAFNTYMINTYGWQVAWRGWSLMLILVFVPLVYIFVINRPEDIGLLPDNEEVKHEDDLAKELEKMEKESFDLSEALRTKEFWFVGIISMMIPLISTGMMFHFFSVMATKNVDTASASVVIGFIAIPGFFMPILASTIVDRFRSKYILSISSVLIGLDLLYMLTVNSMLSASIFILIYGLITNLQSVTLNVIWVRYFGRLHLGSIRGAATVFMVIGSAFGTVPFGLSYDLTGSYTAVFIAMAVLAFLGTVLSLSISKPSKS